MKVTKSKHHKLYNADNIEVLKTLPDNYVDSIVTDPPYGMSKEPEPYEMIKQWYKNGHYDHVSKKGFMGKEWDRFVPQPGFWKEVFRVLKPGGYVISFFSNRTYDIGTLAIRLAGFEIRDQIDWIYGQGMPKSQNVSLALDNHHKKTRKVVGKRRHPTLKCKSKLKRQGKHQFHGTNSIKDEWDITEPNSQDAKKWEGWGTALKPAKEPIVLARKPLIGTMATNILEHGTGGINIDDSRITHSDSDDPRIGKGYKHKAKAGFKPDKSKDYNEDGSTQTLYKPEGRFPTNVILTHDYRCKQQGTKKIKGSKPVPNAKLHEHKFAGATKNTGIGYGKGRNGTMSQQLCDSEGNELIENWHCHPDCPITIMDQQSGISKSSGGSGSKSTGNLGGFSQRERASKTGSNAGGIGDIGGASRFFYCAKASKSEKNAGLENFKHNSASNLTNRKEGSKGINNPRAGAGRTSGSKNSHPTVKPIKLMEYLIKLVTPKNGVVLDPYTGSGTTGVAAYRCKCNFIGIEQSLDYAKIAKARIEHEHNKTKRKPKGLI